MADATLMMLALDASQILNSVQPPAADFPMPVRAPPFRGIIEGCLYRPPAGSPEVSCQQARDCHSDGDCPGSLASYPLAGHDNDYYRMHDKAWRVFDGLVAGKPAADVLPVHLVGIVTTEYGVDGNVQLKGLSGFDVEDTASNGAFVASSIPNANITAGANIAHEIGHALGLAHEDGELVVNGNVLNESVLWPGSDLWGFMKPGNGSAPILNWDAPSLIPGFSHGDVWQGSVPSKFHPRSSGFEFTGCDDDNECRTDLPNLFCCAARCSEDPCP